MPRKPELISIEQAMELTGRDRATIFRWRRRGWLKKHYRHDFEAGRRKAAVDLHELREKLPSLRAEEG